MHLVAGVDIGNSTTEVCIGNIKSDGTLEFISEASAFTTGTKGTIENIYGIEKALFEVLHKINMDIHELKSIRINEATPVIGDTSMETITETIITESTMIGHDPSTPGGEGFGKGITVNPFKIENLRTDCDYILLIDEDVDYEEAAIKIQSLIDAKVRIKGVILKSDEGVLVANRINTVIPIVDEVKGLDRIGHGLEAAIEVATIGKSVVTLSNPYGLASVFNLNPEETRLVVPIAKCLTGLRSAVVIKTEKGSVTERVIPAGKLTLIGNEASVVVDVDGGALEIMKAVENIYPLKNAEGELGTNIGGMLLTVKEKMAKLTNKDIKAIAIKDILAIDTMVKVAVSGGIASEKALEKGVAVAAMVKTDRLPMEMIAKELSKKLGTEVKIAGVEAVMASLGAITTPGVKLPMAILDIGGGSTDAAILDKDGTIKSVHLAGAGDLVTLLINNELGLEDKTIAEEVKKYPLGKIESLFSMRVENGGVVFFDKPLQPILFGRVVIIKENELIPIMKDITMEAIVSTRKSVKEKVFVTNAERALINIAPLNNIRNIPSVVLVGGSALDFEIPSMISKQLSNYKVVIGQGNIRRTQGPRNAVATGLVMSYME